MDNEIKEILDKFDKKLENYELDKKWGELSVDSIGHLFPNEMIIIKDYITKLQQKNKELECDLEELTYSYNELEKKLQEKKEQCDNLIDYVNPYRYYGLNENDYH